MRDKKELTKGTNPVQHADIKDANLDNAFQNTF